MLLTSQQQHGVTVLGPVARDPRWQAKLGNGFDIAAFAVDWKARHAICPAGKVSRKWVPGTDRAGCASMKVQWAHATCLACPRRTDCTTSTRHPRSLTLRGEAAHTVLQRRRTDQTTAACTRQYAARAGVESTHAQALRRCDVRQARYTGLPNVRLQHSLTAAALNLVRAGAWLAGTPRAPTRVSAFARLQVAAA